VSARRRVNLSSGDPLDDTELESHSLLRVDGELRGEVRRGFEKLGLTGSHARNYRVDAAGRFGGRR
jgi:hypothetical protein